MKINDAHYPEVLTEKESKRFWSKVDKRGPIVNPSLGYCWEWTAYRNKKGYGRFYLRGYTIAAHRLSYVIANGSVSGILEMDHLCNNQGCVNPNHLEPVSGELNNLRSNSFSATNARKTHCPIGHSLNHPNLVQSLLKKGGRTCLACSRTRAKYNDSKKNKGIIIDPTLFKSIADEYYLALSK